MSEEKAPAETPPASSEDTPPPPADGKFHFLVVPEKGEDQTPKWETSSTLEDMLSRLHTTLVTCEVGWVYVIIDGKRALLSAPRQVFDLQLPDKNVVRVEPKDQATFLQDGRFVALVSPTQRE